MARFWFLTVGHRSSLIFMMPVSVVSDSSVYCTWSASSNNSWVWTGGQL